MRSMYVVPLVDFVFLHVLMLLNDNTSFVVARVASSLACVGTSQPRLLPPCPSHRKFVT